MTSFHPYTVFPLGDTALILDFGNQVDPGINRKVMDLFHLLRESLPPFVIDLVPAYSSLAIYYDVAAMYRPGEEETSFERMAQWLEKFIRTHHHSTIEETRNLEIPVCYGGGFGTDVNELLEARGLSLEELIRIHTSTEYRVYMIGFLPGFSYMGLVDDRIVMPRRAEPRTVAGGSVGIAGKQTGIYPMECPGGWQIIGRTPKKTFDGKKAEPVLLRPGDQIKFYSITADEFADIQSRDI
jgi:inhibitor of KinA